MIFFGNLNLRRALNITIIKLMGDDLMIARFLILTVLLLKFLLTLTYSSLLHLKGNQIFT